jgi:hypothetical protein
MVTTSRGFPSPHLSSTLVYGNPDARVLRPEIGVLAVVCPEKTTESSKKVDRG